MMTTWTEANFLERLRAPLKDAYDASASLCPDAEMMSAYAHNTANEFVRNAVEKHLRTCADCRELAAQLAEFDAAQAEAKQKKRDEPDTVKKPFDECGSEGYGEREVG